MNLVSVMISDNFLTNHNSTKTLAKIKPAKDYVKNVNNTRGPILKKTFQKYTLNYQKTEKGVVLIDFSIRIFASVVGMT